MPARPPCLCVFVIALSMRRLVGPVSEHAHVHARALAKPPPTMSIPFGGGRKAYNS